MPKTQHRWYVLRKGKQDLGPLTYRQARTTALAIARAQGGKPRDTPTLERRLPGKDTQTLHPHFPELYR